MPDFIERRSGVMVRFAPESGHIHRQSEHHYLNARYEGIEQKYRRHVSDFLIRPCADGSPLAGSPDSPRLAVAGIKRARHEGVGRYTDALKK